MTHIRGRSYLLVGQLVERLLYLSNSVTDLYSGDHELGEFLELNVSITSSVNILNDTVEFGVLQQISINTLHTCTDISIPKLLQPALNSTGESKLSLSTSK